MTLVEVMVASIISGFLIASIVACGYLLNNAKYQYQTNVELTSNARIALEQMVWGVRPSGQPDSRGIAEAVSAVVTEKQIDFTDVDGSLNSVRQNNGNIEYRRGAGGAWITLLDPNGAADFDATKYYVDLDFIQNIDSRLVQVNFVLGKSIRGRWYYASLTTQVAFRNAP